MIRTLKSKDLTNFLHYCSQKDHYNDFYITQDNKRLFLNNLKISKKVFYNCLKRGDKCLIYEENDSIKGILIITGYVDKFPRKYIKILSSNRKVLEGFFKILGWIYKFDLYLKVKKNNPIYNVSKEFGFKFQGSRGKEILLFRKYRERKRINNESKQYNK